MTGPGPAGASPATPTTCVHGEKVPGGSVSVVVNASPTSLPASPDPSPASRNSTSASWGPDAARCVQPGRNVPEGKLTRVRKRPDSTTPSAPSPVSEL